MHLPGQPDTDDMLQFVTWQQADAPVQSVYDPTGLLLFRLRGKRHTHIGVNVAALLGRTVWHYVNAPRNALTFIPLWSVISDKVGKA